MHPIYEHIKKLRLANKYSQEYMANQIGMQQSNYTKLENGKTQITIERLEKIAEVFGMTVLELLAGHEQSTQKKTDLETLERLENRIKELERENGFLERENDLLGREKRNFENVIDWAHFYTSSILKFIETDPTFLSKEKIITAISSFEQALEKTLTDEFKHQPQTSAKIRFRNATNTENELRFSVSEKENNDSKPD